MKLDGGGNISQEKLVNKKASLKESKFWIHRFDKDLLKQLDQKKVLGAEKKGSRVLNNFSPNDRIILFSTIQIDNQRKICFIAYTMVEKIDKNDESLYDYYFSPKKLRLKGIKYFNEPIVAKDIAGDLDFIIDKNKSANYFKSEYREINEKDFRNILRQTSLTKEYPAYFERVSFTMEDFILNTINSLFLVIKRTETRNQYEIKNFIKLLRNVLKEYDISKSYDDLEEFYSRNAWKLGFKHNPSRDPDKFVFLYNRSGKKRNFSYLSLE